MANEVKKAFLCFSATFVLLILSAGPLSSAFAYDREEDLDNWHVSLSKVSKVIVNGNYLLLEFESPVNAWVYCKFELDGAVSLSQPGINCYGAPSLGRIPLDSEREGEKACVAFDESTKAFCESSACSSQPPIDLSIRKRKDVLIYRCNEENELPVSASFLKLRGRDGVPIKVPKPFLVRVRNHVGHAVTYILQAPLRLLLPDPGHWPVPIGAF